ncbi:MAG: hypothetical protein WBF52_06400, partial [Geitlerinemataceae cyanobacterium]
MANAVPAERVTLYQLEQAFGLQEVNRPDWFPEWRTDLPELTLAQQQRLERGRNCNLKTLHLLANVAFLSRFYGKSARMVVRCNGFTVAVRGYSLHPEVWRLINVRQRDTGSIDRGSLVAPQIS